VADQKSSLKKTEVKVEVEVQVQEKILEVGG
jgi:hypothetical protein